MKIKQWIGVLLCTLLCVAMLPTMAFAEEPAVSVWDGSSVATAYESGDGTETNPYEIATADQFAYFSQQISNSEGVDAYYILSCDLDLSAANWTPIGIYPSSIFEGHFDGREHTIKYSINAYSPAGNYSFIGLFGCAGGDISNLNVEGSISLSTYSNATYVGGLSGLFAGNITNCNSNVDITYVVDQMAWIYIGGLTGECRASVIKECAYIGEISASTRYGSLNVGGISGTLYNGTIEFCKNAGTATASGTPGGISGGIVGYAYTGGDNVTGTIRNCYNEGTISGRVAGGVIGYPQAVNNGTLSVENCYSSTMTSGTEVQGAVIATQYATGSASVTIQNCYYLTGSDSYAEQKADINDVYKALTNVSGGAIWVQDANGVPRLYWELTVNPIPEAAFTATSDNSGTLSGVDTSMKYSVDGGTTWNDITGSTMEITGVTADNDVKVYRPGNGTDILDSEIQTIDVTQAAQPTVSGVDCTTSQQNDGQITGVDTTMEYKPSASSEWTEITDTSVTGLASGTYNVRVKANGTVLASAATTVTISEHTCVAQEGWNSDETSHWNTCECGALLNKSSHTFKWIIDKEATSNEKGSKHEECEICGFKKASVEIPATGTKPSTTDKTSKDKTNSPKTGDNTNLSLYISLLAMSGLLIAILAVFVLRKKKAFRHK